MGSTKAHIILFHTNTVRGNGSLQVRRIRRDDLGRPA
jgi:hypothetical protein